MFGLAVCLFFLIPATAACLACLVPTLAALRQRKQIPALPQSPLSIAVLIPAHNEETALPRALHSLTSWEKIFVVADNCTDDTASVARRLGAHTLERSAPEQTGKGYALSFGLKQVLATNVDAVLILDADCELSHAASDSIQAAFATGATVVQLAVHSRNADAGAAGYVAAVGSAFDATVAAGRAALGFSVPLRGTGMVFHRSILERLPWNAFGPVEDAEYTTTLRRARVTVHYCGNAVVSCRAPHSTAALCRQRRRWRASTRLFTSKPIMLLHLVFTLVICSASGVWLWPLLLVVITGSLYLRAMYSIGFTPHRIGLLLGSSAIVARLGWLTLAGFLRAKPSRWEHS